MTEEELRDSYSVIFKVKEDKNFTTHLMWDENNSFDKEFHSYMVNTLRLAIDVVLDIVNDVERMKVNKNSDPHGFFGKQLFSSYMMELKSKYSAYDPEWGKKKDAFLAQLEKDLETYSDDRGKLIFNSGKEQ